MNDDESKLNHTPKAPIYQWIGPLNSAWLLKIVEFHTNLPLQRMHGTNIIS